MDGGYALFIESVSGDLTEITMVFDSEYTFTLPFGYIDLVDNNLLVVESAIGKNLLEDVENGKEIKVEAVIQDYGFYAKFETSPMFDADIVAINGHSIDP